MYFFYPLTDWLFWPPNLTSAVLPSSDRTLDNLQGLAKVHTSHLACCFLSIGSSYRALTTGCRFLIKSCISCCLLFLLNEKEVVVVAEARFQRSWDNCSKLSGVSFPLLNGWFDRNRWLIWALSCEWGCTIPSANDRGSQAPSFGPSGAKNWPVWWVPVDYFTTVGHHPSPTAFVLHSFSSHTPDVLVLFSSFTFLSSSLYFFPACITCCVFLVPLSSTPLFLLMLDFF